VNSIRFRHRLFYLILGLTIGSVAFFGMEAENEHNFIDRIIERIDADMSTLDPSDRSEAFVKEAVHYTNFLLKRRSNIFNSTADEIPWKQKLFPSTLRASIDGQGSCGGYSNFLMTILKRKGYSVKACQLKVGDAYGGHQTVCVALAGKLVLVDPWYEEMFLDENGHLSDINEVGRHWTFYSSRIADPSYRPEYTYEHGFRFTNWDKFGGFSRGIYRLLILVKGKEWTDQVSLRPFFLDVFSIYFFLSVTTLFILVIYRIRKKLRIAFIRWDVRRLQQAPAFSEPEAVQNESGSAIFRTVSKKAQLLPRDGEAVKVKSE